MSDQEDEVSKELVITNRDDAPSLFEMKGVRYTETGLTLPESLPYDLWEDMLKTLGRLGRGIQWAIGDCINFGDHKYGEVYSQAIELTGYNYNTLANFAWVARVFPPEKRRERLYFDHHSSVAWLYQQRPDVAEEILDVAVDGALSVREVRNDVREACAELGIKQPVIPPPSAESSQRRRGGGITITEDGEYRDLGGRGSGSGGRDTGDGASPGTNELRGLDEMTDQMLDIVVRLAAARPPQLLALQQEAVTWLHEHGLAGELYALRE